MKMVLRSTAPGKSLVSILIIVQSYYVSSAQVTEIYTDYGGYWKSSTTAINPIVPNNSHNVIAFTYNSVVYSTGVNDALLTSRGVSYTSANFKALPITSIGGTTASNTYIALGTLYDGVANGYSTPLPSLRIIDVLTDGINGLNIGTGVTNVPASAAMNFPITNINTATITDAIPDIVYSQTAQPESAGDKLFFVNSSGVTIGDTISVTWTSVGVLGGYTCDLYSLSTGSCDAAIITGGNATNQPKDLRLVGLRLSQFGITATNSSSVARLVIRPGGASDPAFVAYNADAVSIPSPVITAQPQTQTICPGMGNNVTFSVTATGPGLTYQWKKNGIAIPGATSDTYTITGVTDADAGQYEVTITNAGGAVTSSIAYLNTVIKVQPLPASQTVATGRSVTLSVTATNATGYQWQRNGVNIDGATSPDYTINPLTTSNSGSFTVNVLNSAGGGCASVVSNAAIVIPATVLYSKSTGNLNLAATWGVNTNGSGSTPANFTRSEHIFKVANRTTASTGANLTIAGTLDLMNAEVTIHPGTSLSAGRIIRSGTSGTLKGSSTSNLTVSGVSDLYFAGGGQVLKNVTVSGGTATLYTPLSITAGAVPGVVTVSSGTLFTSGYLTLKSDSDGTATIGVSAGTISGTVTVERHMPPRRAWRLMGAPVSATGAPTINAAWQEGASLSTADMAPGFGTHITGGSVQNGFDQSPADLSNLKYYSNASWAGIPNTNATAVTAYEGYMFFVRGNRAYDITTTTQYTTPTATVLRTVGNLNQGTQATKTIQPIGFTLVTNPYASPVDISAIVSASTNIKNRFRVWDPSLGGANGVGGFVTLDWNGSSYTATPASSLSNIVQPWQAFFAESNDGVNAGSLAINENCKSGATITLPFGRPVENGEPSLAINLEIIEAKNNASIADGVLVRYNDNYANAVDKEDAEKIPNFTENLAIMSHDKQLTIERRPLPSLADAVRLYLAGTKATAYKLNVKTENFQSHPVIPFLYDSYLKAMIPLRLSDTTGYLFTINSIPASGDPYRFRIVFRPSSALPGTFLFAKGSLKNEKILLSWKMENDAAIRSFHIEKRILDKFYSIAETAPKQDNGENREYNFKDMDVSIGANIYRIKSIDAGGNETYSQIITVNHKGEDRNITVNSRILDRYMHLTLRDMPAGVYRFRLTNSLGQTVLAGKFQHSGGNAFSGIHLKRSLAKGIYTLSIISTNHTLENYKVFY